jgi:hypothetical protein
MVKKDKSKISKLKTITNKPILKSKKVTLKLPTKEIESTWDDTSRFFKNEYEETKALFFK